MKQPKKNSLWFWNKRSKKISLLTKKTSKKELLTKILSSEFFLNFPKLMTKLVVNDIQIQFFVTMFLPTTISDVTVGNAFMKFGTVHTVYAGTYENRFQEIKNWKWHVTITAFHSKSELPHEIIFEVMWPLKKVSCKICGTVHMLSDEC